MSRSFWSGMYIGAIVWGLTMAASSCGRPDAAAKRVLGPQGNAGTPGSSCSVTKVEDCVFVTCTDGTSELIKGSEKHCL